MARKTDDGRRVGIRVFKTVGQIPCEHWIVRNTVQAVAIANTLHDFLTGQIVGKDYKWKSSRKYIFQRSEHYTNRKYITVDRVDTDDVERRIRIGLPYYNRNFMWDDRTRKPETKPAELMLQDTQAGLMSFDHDISADLLESSTVKSVQVDTNISEELYNKGADIVDWRETSVSVEYEEYMEELYQRWMLPHHQDLQRQGCRIYTGEYVE
jgi:hypothetical protein